MQQFAILNEEIPLPPALDMISVDDMDMEPIELSSDACQTSFVHTFELLCDNFQFGPFTYVRCMGMSGTNIWMMLSVTLLGITGIN